MSLVEGPDVSNVAFFVHWAKKWKAGGVDGGVVPGDGPVEVFLFEQLGLHYLNHFVEEGFGVEFGWEVQGCVFGELDEEFEGLHA